MAKGNHAGVSFFFVKVKPFFLLLIPEGLLLSVTESRLSLIPRETYGVFLLQYRPPHLSAELKQVWTPSPLHNFAHLPYLRSGQQLLWVRFGKAEQPEASIKNLQVNLFGVNTTLGRRGEGGVEVGRVKSTLQVAGGGAIPAHNEQRKPCA